MLKRVHNSKREEGGFTLIELLIVIVILGVLAGIVVFSVAGISDRGIATACKADVKTVNVASEAYNAKTGDYAATIGALVAADFLQSAPSSTDYTVGYDSVSGRASGTTGSPAAAC